MRGVKRIEVKLLMRPRSCVDELYRLGFYDGVEFLSEPSGRGSPILTAWTGRRVVVDNVN